MNLGFKGQKTKSNTSVPVENHDVREKQILYLKDHQFSEEGRKFLMMISCTYCHDMLRTSSAVMTVMDYWYPCLKARYYDYDFVWEEKTALC
jgi:hypothetical protein